jgi:hypothetical protein
MFSKPIRPIALGIGGFSCPDAADADDSGVDDRTDVKTAGADKDREFTLTTQTRIRR